MKVGTIRIGTLRLLVTEGTTGCAREVWHSESHKPDWFGAGRTHTESTVHQNPDGTTESSRRITNKILDLCVPAAESIVGRISGPFTRSFLF